MKEIIKNIIIFGVGAGIGAFVTDKIVRDKYRTIADNEIAEIKAMYFEDNNEPETEDTNDSSEEVEDYLPSRVEEVKNISINNSYVSKSSEPKDPVITDDEPYYIEEDEYGSEPDYLDPVTLYYYTDGVLADDIDERATPGIVPDDFADHFAFGSSIYVRNPKIKEDIEILQMDSTYAELCEEKPHLKYRD